MDWPALSLSLQLAFATTLVLLPMAVLLARPLAWRPFPGKSVVEALVALPLVLPPTVLGFYLLVSFGEATALGQLYHSLTGRALVFTFDGLLLASVIFNLPFAVQPMQRAFDAIPREVREAAWCCGMTRWQALWKIELPLAWPGLLTAIVLTFAHTLGEFGVVLMVGGNIGGETRTIAISIYDRVQAFDDHGAAVMSAALVALSLAAITAINMLGKRIGHRG
ncbi:MAG: molybdate ABC transporter permease subunit [Betaproteobacteria bacterium]|jgi:molybdate transport system permease protein|nr:molybdate ABC transporter permease subunit [Betaproteobacteria bacterium]